MSPVGVRGPKLGKRHRKRIEAGIDFPTHDEARAIHRARGLRSADERANSK
jgi:hypothetical protein